MGSEIKEKAFHVKSDQLEYRIKAQHSGCTPVTDETDNFVEDMILSNGSHSSLFIFIFVIILLLIAVRNVSQI